MNVTDRAMASEEWVRIEALEVLFGATCDRIRELEAENERLKQERAEALALALVDETDWTQDHSRALNALLESRGASDEEGRTP